MKEIERRKMTTIGLDLSISSTGVCICVDGEVKKYVLIQNKPTKKCLSYLKQHPEHKIEMIVYGRLNASKVQPLTQSRRPTCLRYEVREQAKTITLYNITQAIIKLVDEWKPDKVVIEGVAYNANGNTADLSGLNFMVRGALILNGLEFDAVKIVSPNTNKKNATGNGLAKKEQMIEKWAEREKVDVSELGWNCKLDDIADAYFLAVLG